MPLPVSIQRLGYRLAYRGLQAIWFLTRPRKRGVKCVLSDDGRVLLVRHTYGRRDWDLPGGSVKRRESPLTTAQREMREELGISIEDWQELGTVSTRLDHRSDTMYCFGVEVSDPQLKLARGELQTAQWFSPDRLPRPRSRYVDEILAMNSSTRRQASPEASAN